MNSKETIRELIAKLMSSENVNVIHSKEAHTAAFNVETRDLILPIFSESISDDLYTLFITHEVGHALYTPAEELREVLDSESNIISIINIVEDARIEKLIQNKYPGTRKCFVSGYRELFNSNFFGTEDRDLSTYNLLDRLNIHFKIGSFSLINVPFTQEEKQWVHKVDSCDSFSDVVRISLELKEYLQSNSEQNQEENSEESNQNSDNEESEDQDQSVEQQPNSKESSEESETDDIPENNSNDDQLDSQSSNSKNTSLDNSESDIDSSEQSSIQSETQDSFENNFSKHLVDNSYYKSCEIFNFPEIDVDEMIVSYKKIHDNISSFKDRNTTYHSNLLYKSSASYKQKCKVTVNQMANVFEMKKNASLHARASTAKTGQLDVNKVFSYRYNDDVFKKISTIPEGKSHGLVMFFDMSSSMDNTISGCLEQILNLVMFCKRVNIPFDVYGFSDNGYTNKGSGITRKHYYDSTSANFYQCKNPKDNTALISGDFNLRHYFSSKMSNIEYNTAIENVLYMIDAYKGRVKFPYSETLQATPLIPCLISAKTIINRFRSEHSLDVVNAIFLTDGGDNHGIVIVDPNNHKSKTKLSPYSSTVILQDDKTKKRWIKRKGSKFTSLFLDYLKSETGARLIGYDLRNRLNAGGGISVDVHSNNEHDEKFFKTNGFAKFSGQSIATTGYDSVYIIKNGNSSMSTNVGEFDSAHTQSIDVDSDKKFLKKNIKAVARDFNKYMNKSNNRVFINKFIEEISNEKVF